MPYADPQAKAAFDKRRNQKLSLTPEGLEADREKKRIRRIREGKAEAYWRFYYAYGVRNESWLSTVSDEMKARVGKEVFDSMDGKVSFS